MNEAVARIPLLHRLNYIKSIIFAHSPLLIGDSAGGFPSAFALKGPGGVSLILGLAAAALQALQSRKGAFHVCWD